MALPFSVLGMIGSKNSYINVREVPQILEGYTGQKVAAKQPTCSRLKTKPSLLENRGRFVRTIIENGLSRWDYSSTEGYPRQRICKRQK